eukprot:2690158-Amphidinium_carterae.2
MSCCLMLWENVLVALALEDVLQGAANAALLSMIRVFTNVADAPVFMTHAFAFDTLCTNNRKQTTNWA